MAGQKLILTVITLLSVTSSLASRPQLSLHSQKIVVRSYDVHGTQLEELRKNLRSSGPLDRFGVRRDAQVEWKIWWSWPTVNHTAAFQKVEVDHQIVLTIPNWRDRSNADGLVKKRWDEFFNRLLSHELQHVTHVLSNLEQIKTSIIKASANNPALTPFQANKIGHRILRRIQHLDFEYDKRTQHGRLEGIDL